MFLIVLPILTSVVVRTFSWIVILGKQGVLNSLLLASGIIDTPLNLLFTETGVIIVLAQVQMPLIVLPLMATLSRIDPNLRNASAALGAGEWRTFWKVTLPLSVPGIIAGCILAFAACVTAFVTQTLIGGARLVYMPLFIYQQAVGANNWPFAAAISVIFMVAVLVVVFGLNAAGRASKRADLWMTRRPCAAQRGQPVVPATAPLAAATRRPIVDANGTGATRARRLPTGTPVRSCSCSGFVSAITIVFLIAPTIVVLITSFTDAEPRSSFRRRRTRCAGTAR